MFMVVYLSVNIIQKMSEQFVLTGERNSMLPVNVAHIVLAIQA